MTEDIRHETTADDARAVLQQRVAAARARDAATIPAYTGESDAPVSYNQERMWLLDRTGRGSHLYNIYHALRITGPLDEFALRRALDGLLARHAALRTTFGERDDGVVQQVAEAAPAVMDVVDLAEPTNPQGSSLRDRIDEVCHAPFDLARDPLFRATLLRCPDGHVLVLVMHHIASDGWSADVLRRDLADGYVQAVAGREVGRGEPSPSYVDFAAWQRGRTSGPGWEADLTYWRDTLAEQPEILELVTDRPRPANRQDDGDEVILSLPAEVVDGLRSLSGREGVTFYVVLVAAVRALLHRYTDQDHFVLASTVSGRHHPGVEDIVGFFVDTIALGGDLSGDPDVRELLGREKESVLGAFAHQDVPFERVVDEVRTGRDLSRNPLAQVLVQLHHDAGSWQLPGLEVEELTVDNPTAKFDLSFLFRETDAGVRLTLEYATALFDRATVQAAADRLVRVMRSFAAHPDLRLREIDLLSPEEADRVTFAEPPLTHPPDRIDVAFEGHARRRPGAIAVVDGDRGPVTYRELDRDADRLARRLRRAGLRRGDRAAVRLERDATLLIAWLAVLKAGGVYVPIGAREAAERAGSILADAGPRVLVTTSGLLAGVPNDGITEVLLDTPEPAGAQDGADTTAVPSAQRSPEDLAYVFYTSGSTGRPKGIAFPHHMVVTSILGMAQRFELDQDDRVLAVASPSFDMSVVELLAPMVIGASTVTVDEASALSPPALRRVIHDHGVTVVQGTPDRWRVVAEGTDLTGVTMIVGAESLTPQVAHELLDSGATVWHCYGPTEANLWCTAHRVERAGVGASATVPVGTPLPGLACHVVDQHLEVVPDGVPGEVLLSARHIPEGYWGSASERQQAFLAAPFGPGRAYRTGDRGRRLADGTLEFLGRFDYQVKIRGHRVELGEVEARIGAHPDVARAVVVVDEQSGERRLVVYAVPRHERLAESDLRSHARAHLPGYMQPSAYLVLTQLPLTRSGKVDRAALPPVVIGEVTSRAPDDPIQRTIAGIWSEVLDAGTPDIEADFFRLGGNSLAAVKVVSRLSAAFGIELGFFDLFAEPTVAAQAAAVDDAVDRAVAELSDEEVSDLLTSPGPR